MPTTTIQVREATADELARRKRRGDTYDDVIHRLLGEREAAPAAVDTLPVPGSSGTADRRRAAIGRLRDHLQEQGTASRSEFLELVDPDEVGYDSAESFWSNCIKGRDTLQALPGVEPPGEGGHQWRWSEP